MSNAWEGYHEGRRSRRSRRWRYAAGGFVLLLGVLFGVARCLPQGGMFDLRPGRADGEGLRADTTVVVFNAGDPLSRDLADYYAGKRGIPPAQVVGLKCSDAEEISREEYDDTLAAPLRAQFDARGWWQRSPDNPGQEPSSTVTQNRMRCLVLMRGVPLRIRQTGSYPGDAGIEQCFQPAGGAVQVVDGANVRLKWHRNRV